MCSGACYLLRFQHRRRAGQARRNFKRTLQVVMTFKRRLTIFLALLIASVMPTLAAKDNTATPDKDQDRSPGSEVSASIKVKHSRKSGKEHSAKERKTKNKTKESADSKDEQSPTDSPKQSKQKKHDKKSKTAAKSRRHASELSTRTGLDAQTLLLVNTGQWNDAIERLKSLTEKEKVPSRNTAWLSFALMYQGKHGDINDLEASVKSLQANPSDPLAGMIVQTFALVSRGKFQEAADLLNLLEQNPQSQNDELFLLAKACVALKLGHPQEAATIVEKIVDEDPGFAWGFRTLGFIQDKSLKNPGAAERAYERALAVQPDFRDVRDLLVDVRLAQNNFDGAIELVRGAIKEFPADASYHYRLSQIYTQQFRLLEALAELDKAANLAKNDARWYRNRATIFRHQGKLPEAIAEQKKAVEFGKDKAFELIELASLQELGGDATSAIATLNKAAQENPQSTAARQKLITLLQKEQKWNELIEEYIKGIKQNPKQSALHLGLAMALNNTGKEEEAINELKEVANLEQNSPVAHREIGKIELHRKNYQAAAKSYTRALNINPASVEDLVALGYCYANNNDLIQAETAFVTGLALQQLGMTSGAPVQVNQYDIMRSLATVLMSEGRYREAAVNLEAVVAADKDAMRKLEDGLALYEARALKDRSDESINKLISAFEALHTEEQQDTIADVVDTLFRLGRKDLVSEKFKNKLTDELKKDDPLLYVRLTEAAGNLKDAAEVATAAGADEKRDPAERAELYRALAAIRMQEKDEKSAHDALKKSTELNPKDFESYQILGQLYITEKKFDDAIAATQKALEFNPYSAMAYFFQGEAYLGLNKITEASGNIAKATELYPNFLDAHKKLREIYLKQSKTVEAAQEAAIIANLEKPEVKPVNKN